ncbi:hypothetical protein MAR_014566 [Mya arenaria]|uniref:Uncharacterized protein n=1 Tax=Mya arenaria TaxID=6604 RepID=A0ABY7G4N5_MYAAR|nr:hypothetical protein MAR_014566 [Mya arenaria]
MIIGLFLGKKYELMQADKYSNEACKGLQRKKMNANQTALQLTGFLQQKVTKNAKNRTNVEVTELYQICMSLLGNSFHLYFVNGCQKHKSKNLQNAIQLIFH